MPDRPTQQCAMRDAVKAFADGALPDAQREDVLSHLEECEGCRGFFHRQTADDFPRVRNYTIVERIGEGGFGIVYRAIHHEKRRTEALKVLYGQSDVRARFFENEVHLIGRLRHPNIATLYDAHLRSPPLYYCMEFVEGRRLDEYLAREPVTLAERIRLVIAVADAVDYAHAHGVVHRDIKPQNILIDRSGQPRIVDFGIAKRLGLTPRPPGEEGSDSPAGAVGTLGYMSPEQAQGGAVDRRSDVYSLGALLYHCVTGRAPRQAGSSERLESALRELEVARAPDLAAIVRRCMAFAPEQRYRTAGELAADLKSYLLGLPTRAATNDSAAYRARRIAAYVVRNHPLPVCCAVVMLAAATLTALLWSAGARSLVGSTPLDRGVAVVGFLDSTLAGLRDGSLGEAAAGVDPLERKSWRVLHGQLMRRLAAAEPAVVVWDYFLPGAHPDYDRAFVEGVRALRAPVVVGVRRFDVNAQPELSPDIRDAVHAFGALLAHDPGALEREVEIALGIQRGFEPMVASLAVAALGALRAADCAVVPVLDERAAELELRYRRRQAAPDEPRWLPRTDRLPLSRVVVSEGDPLTLPGDRLPHARFALSERIRSTGEVIPYERVLSAPDEQLRAWFHGRAVIIGEMFGTADRHQLADGTSVYGVQIQADVLRSLIAGTSFVRLSRRQIAARTFGWCALAGCAAACLPLGRRWSPRAVAAAVILLGCGALALGAYLAVRVATVGGVELGIALAATLAAAPPVVLLRVVRRRQLQLSPDVMLLKTARPGTTTVAAAAREDLGGGDTPTLVQPVRP